ncbi:MAG: DUF1572 family protein [bacterium]
MIEKNYLDDALQQLGKYKKLADAALAQIDDKHLFEDVAADGNSIAIIMKHMAGNMRSRWTDFLTSDGEKAERLRDTEFILEEADTRDAIFERWQNGWDLTLEAISSLRENDLGKTVKIRGEPHTVVEAMNRQLTHYAYHVGQIILLARYFAGKNWRSLSIPRGKSAEFEVSKRGQTYDPK